MCSILYIFDITYLYLVNFMKYSKKIDYLLALIGCIVALYAQTGVRQNVFLLVLGIVILMYGLFKISLTITPKKDKNEDSTI